MMVMLSMGMDVVQIVSMNIAVMDLYKILHDIQKYATMVIHSVEMDVMLRASLRLVEMVLYSLDYERHVMMVIYQTTMDVVSFVR